MLYFTTVATVHVWISKTTKWLNMQHLWNIQASIRWLSDSLAAGIVQCGRTNFYPASRRIICPVCRIQNFNTADKNPTIIPDGSLLQPSDIAIIYLPKIHFHTARFFCEHGLVRLVKSGQLSVLLYPTKVTLQDVSILKVFHMDLLCPHDFSLGTNEGNNYSYVSSDRPVSFKKHSLKYLKLCVR
jgi:hypothetical protein